MTYFQRLRKFNPNHDPHSGEFTSAGGGGNGGISPQPLHTPYNSTHHVNAAAHALMNAIKRQLSPQTFNENEPVILSAVKNVLLNRASLTNMGKASLIKSQLVANGNAALQSALRLRQNGREVVYSAMQQALAATARPGPGSTVTTPYTGPHPTPGSRPGRVSPVVPPASSTPAASSMGVRTGLENVPASELQSGPRTAVAEIARLRALGGQREFVGASTPASAARTMSSPIAAAVAEEPAPAPGRVTANDLEKAGFIPNYYGGSAATERVVQCWPKVFGAISPQEVRDTMFKSVVGSEEKISMSSSGNAITFSVSNPTLRITRMFEADADGRVTVDHSYFQINSNDDRAKGIGKQFLSDGMALYKKMGNVDTVTIHANIDVGGYAWAKYAFTPDQSSWDSLKRGFSRTVSTMSTTSDFTPETKERVLRLLKNPDPRTLWDVADLSVARDGKPLAKTLMLNSDWHGKLDLTNPAVMGRFNDYVNKGQRAA